MNVLIIGDSWGTGLWLDRRLLEHKHTVFNKSIYGGTNINAITQGIDFQIAVQHLFKMDLIIFFNTDYGRDLPFYYYHDTTTNKPKHFTEALDGIHRMTMDRIKTLRSLADKAKWAVIGGHAGLYKPQDWQFADFLIPNYREELLGVRLPTSQFFSFYERYFIEYKFLFNADEINDEIDKIQLILDTVHKRKDIFTDTVHPNFDTQTALIDRILNHIK
jgi:hypothetical protein